MLQHACFSPADGALRGRISRIPCKIPCLQGIWLETGAISTASPATQSCGLRQPTTCASQARKSGLFAHSTWSPGSRSPGLGGERAESLRPIPEKLPFCGDYWRRLVRSQLPPEGGRGSSCTELMEMTSRRSRGNSPTANCSAVRPSLCLRTVPRLNPIIASFVGRASANKPPTFRAGPCR